MKIVQQYQSSRDCCVEELLTWLDFPSSSYYYKPKDGKPGRKPTTQTLYKNEWVDNTVVIEQVKQIPSGPYNAYGYQSTTEELRELGYWIDDKKV